MENKIYKTCLDFSVYYILQIFSTSLAQRLTELSVHKVALSNPDYLDLKVQLISAYALTQSYMQSKNHLLCVICADAIRT